MSYSVNAPKTATIRGQHHELAYLTPQEKDLLSKMFGWGQDHDGSQIKGPKGIDSFNDNPNEPVGNEDMADPSLDPNVTGLDDGEAFGDDEDVPGMPGLFGREFDTFMGNLVAGLLGVPGKSVTGDKGFWGAGTTVGVVSTIGEVIADMAEAAGLEVSRGGQPGFGADGSGSNNNVANMNGDGPEANLASLLTGLGTGGDRGKAISIYQKMLNAYEANKGGENNSYGQYGFPYLSQEDVSWLSERLGSQVQSANNASDNWGIKAKADLAALGDAIRGGVFKSPSEIERSYGAQEGFNKFLAELFPDFVDDFGNGNFGNFAEQAGIRDYVAQLEDEWYGNNDALNKALSSEYKFMGPFDGKGSFWNHVDEQGIDRNEVNDFIDKFNGTGDYANPFDGPNALGPDAFGIFGTDEYGPGHITWDGDVGTWTPGGNDPFSSQDMNFNDFFANLSTSLSEMFQPIELDVDLPDLDTDQPEVFLGATKEEADRANLASMRYNLDPAFRRSSRYSRPGFDGTGLMF